MWRMEDALAEQAREASPELGVGGVIDVDDDDDDDEIDELEVESVFGGQGRKRRFKVEEED